MPSNRRFSLCGFMDSWIHGQCIDVIWMAKLAFVYSRQGRGAFDTTMEL